MPPGLAFRSALTFSKFVVFLDTIDCARVFDLRGGRILLTAFQPSTRCLYLSSALVACQKPLFCSQSFDALLNSDVTGLSASRKMRRLRLKLGGRFRNHHFQVTFISAWSHFLPFPWMSRDGSHETFDEVMHDRHLVEHKM